MTLHLEEPEETGLLIEDLLKRYVEGYIFRDLEEMEKIDVERDGNCGYPMVMMTMSTMELLGALMHGEDFHDDHGQAYFSYYWRNFFRSVSPKYQGTGNLSDLLYRLVRHGLAHGPLLKHGVNITKSAKTDEHFVFRPRLLTIDCVQFWQDLRISYRDGVRPIVEGAKREIEGQWISRDSVQARLNDIDNAYRVVSDRCFKDNGIRKRVVQGLLPDSGLIVGRATGSMNFFGSASIGNWKTNEPGGQG